MISKCQAAVEWWKTNAAMWSKVRDNWDDVFAKGKNLELKAKVKDKPLYEHLFSMEPNTEEQEIKKVIKSFVKR